MWNSWWEWNWKRQTEGVIKYAMAKNKSIENKEEGPAATYPDIALSREEPFRDASGVQAGSGDVEGGHEQQPAHLSHGGGFDQTLADDKVEGGNHAAQTQTHKHA